jgi:hypothetical protein
MRTLQAIVVMLCIGPFASSPALSSSYDGSSDSYQATVATPSLPGLMIAGSGAASTDRAIRVALTCPPGYVPSRYYSHCVPAPRLSSHPSSTPGAEQLPSAAQRNAYACSQKGLMPGGDAGVAQGDRCLCPPPLRAQTPNGFVFSRNECF